MKFLLLLTISFITTILSFNCYAETIGGNKSKETSSKSERAIDKSISNRVRQDQKYLKRAKKQYWAAQSKQVKRTIKQTNKRNRINYLNY